MLSPWRRGPILCFGVFLLELRLRALTSLFIGPLVLLVLHRGGTSLLVSVVIATSIASWEFYGLTHEAGYRPFGAVGLAIALGLVMQAFLHLDLSWEIASLGLLTTAVWGYLVRPPSKGFLADWACTFVGALYCGGLLSHAILLRSLEKGLAWGAIVLFGTWTCDTSGYLVGKRWGRHKLAPRISPNKTWEGAIGSFLCSFIVVALTAALFGIPLVHGSALGLLVPLAVILGDLTESMLKRSAGVKDAGNLIPGHGGLLDRIDGLIFAIPTVYYYVVGVGWA
jgi:phosphatidate cytidylyltransferase